MPFVVIHDANALYPSTLRDLLNKVAQAGLIQARWTHQILDETFHNLEKNRPDLSPDTFRHTRELIIVHVSSVLSPRPGCSLGCSLTLNEQPPTATEAP